MFMLAPVGDEDPHPRVIPAATRAVSRAMQTVHWRFRKNTKDKINANDDHAAMSVGREEVEATLVPVPEAVMVRTELPLPPWMAAG